MFDLPQNTDVVRIEESIELLKKFVNDPAIDPLISALDALRKDPDNKVLLDAMTESFSGLGIAQGSVLTYAPYVGLLLTDDIFGEN
jgi:hypothetical protein